jgi:hypothetical protein
LLAPAALTSRSLLCKNARSAFLHNKLHSWHGEAAQWIELDMEKMCEAHFLHIQLYPASAAGAREAAGWKTDTF